MKTIILKSILQDHVPDEIQAKILRAINQTLEEEEAAQEQEAAKENLQKLRKKP